MRAGKNNTNGRHLLKSVSGRKSATGDFFQFAAVLGGINSSESVLKTRVKFFECLNNILKCPQCCKRLKTDSTEVSEFLVSSASDRGNLR
ncbi:unnamed protein product [Hermetia illucens]|uniref:Uncharacterized protein n=1 Tax=Hermetia illucens TaxID=343691 RepID=A0A7R8UJX5_HERIL|nr:unnamed protein product [Hermetia illucens]